MVVGEKLISELSNHFFTHELMGSLRVVYPQFWLSLNVDGSFQQHLKMLCAQETWACWKWYLDSTNVGSNNIGYTTFFIYFDNEKQLTCCNG